GVHALVVAMPLRAWLDPRNHLPAALAAKRRAACSRPALELRPRDVASRTALRARHALDLARHLHGRGLQSARLRCMSARGPSRASRLDHASRREQLERMHDDLGDAVIANLAPERPSGPV